MARPRTPSKILDMKGAYKNHPERKKERSGEPQPKADSVKPPRGMTNDQRKIWREIVGQAPPGVYTNMDRQVLETVCILLDKFRKGYTGKAEPISAAELNQLMRGYSALGMTPADRSKISVPKKPDTKDGWTDA